MSTSFWLDRTPERAAQEFDAIIVGAGITGMSIAYWLNQEDPSLKICILEKSRLGFGATGRNAGFITCGSVEHFNRMIGKHGMNEAVDIWRFSETNLRLLQEHIVQDSGDLLQFEKKGCYSLAAQDSEFTELKKVSEIMGKINIPVEVLSSSDVQSRLGVQNFVGGIKYLDDATINPIQMLNQMRRKVKAELFEQTEVMKVETSNNGNRVVCTDQGRFEAPMVIFGLNGYMASVLPYFDDKIYPTRGQILMMEPVPRFMDGPCYANFYLDYFRQLPSGELLIGGFRQVEKATEVGYSDHTTQGIQTALHQFVVTHLPQFVNKKVTHRWAGVMGFSSDGQPMVGAMPDDNQVYFCGGYTAHGIGLGFHSAKCLVDMIYGREVPRWLSARRFN